MKSRPCLILASVLAAAMPVMAQPTFDPSTPSRNINAQSIPTDLLQKFISVTAINACLLLQEKIDYKTVLKTGVSAVAGIVYTDYASKISGINGDKPLGTDQLGNGIALDLAFQISGRCEKLVPTEELKKIREFVEANSPKK